MATIPTYTSRERATPQAPAIMQQADTAGQTISSSFAQSKIGEQAGQIISELGQRMIKVENANARSRANIEVQTALRAYEEKVNTEPDLDNALKDYDNYMSNVRNSAAKNFKHREAREEFIQKFELENIVFRNGLDKQVMKKKVDLGRTNTLMEMDLETNNYISAITEQERIDSRTNIKNIMDTAVEVGFFSHEEGYKRIESTIESADKTLEDRKELNRRKEKEAALALKEAVNNRELEFIKMKIDGKDLNGVPISREEMIKMVRQDMDKGNIKSKFADIYINSLKSPKSVGTKTKSAKYVGFVNDMLFNKTKPNDITIALMESNTAGALSDEDFNELITFNKEVNASDVLGKMFPNVSIMKGLQYWGDENAGAKDESKVRMFKDYTQQVRQGIDPETASKQTIRNEVLFLFPQVKTAPKEGIDIIDLNGVIKHITPDGELTVKEKKK